MLLKLAVMLSGVFLMGWAIAWWAMPGLRRYIGTRFVINYLAILCCDLLIPNVYAFWAVTLVSTVATIRGRDDAMCRMMLLLPLVPGVSLTLSIGGSFFGTYQSFTCVAIACAIACAMSKPLPQRPVRGFTPEDGFILVLILILLMGVRFQSATGLIRVIMSGLMDYVLPYWLLRQNVRRTDQVDRLIACLVASSFAMIAVAMFEVRSGWNIADVLRRFTSMGSAASSATRGGSTRAAGAFGNALIFAHYMALMVIGMFTCRRWFRKSVWPVCLGLVLIGFITPQSRGAYLAIVPGGIVLLAAQRRFGAAAALLALAGTGGLALSLLRRFSTYLDTMLAGNAAAGHYDYRGLLFDRGMDEFWKRPIFGATMTDVTAALRDIRQGEGIIDFVNTYLAMALTSGIAGLGAFVILLAVIARRLIARAKRGENLEATRAARAFLLSCLAISAVDLIYMSFYERLATLVITAVALSRTTSAELMRARRRAPAPALAIDLGERRLSPV